MNRTIKDATVNRYHYDGHDQMRTHLNDFILAYNFTRRLKTLKRLNPYEFLCKLSLAEPDRFRIEPIHQNAGTVQRIELVGETSRRDVLWHSITVEGNAQFILSESGFEDLIREIPILIQLIEDLRE